MPNPPIKEHVQSLELGRDYTFYEIDLRRWNLDYLRFYEGDEGDRQVRFAGIDYSPWPIITSGWRSGSSGALPRPRFAVANLNRIFTPMVQNADGFRMAPFRRIRTYEMYLDIFANGQINPDADGTQHKPVDYYEINRIVRQGLVNGVEAIQFELIAPIDRPNANIPRLVVTRDQCQRVYRTFQNGAFNYTHVDCPYTGVASFDRDGNPVADEFDNCPHNEAGCKARFGDDAVLPALFFPGVERTRAR